MNIDNQLDLDIYPIWNVPFWKTKIFIFSLIFLFCIFLVAYFWLRKNKQNNILILKEKTILEQLRELDIPTNSSIEEKKKFYFKLINILKQQFKIAQRRLSLDTAAIAATRDERLDGKTEKELLSFIEEKFNFIANDLKPVINNAIWVKYSKDDFYTQMQLDLNIVIDIATKLETA